MEFWDFFSGTFIHVIKHHWKAFELKLSFDNKIMYIIDIS